MSVIRRATQTMAPSVVEAVPVFEFHGWINIWTYDPNRGPFDAAAMASMEEALHAIRTRLADERYDAGWFEARETFNGQIMIVTHGLRNHRRDDALELFKWVGECYPFSYGLLYTNDAEDSRHENEFAVYRLAHGKVAEVPDTMLSPIVPTVRSVYPWDGPDESSVTT